MPPRLNPHVNALKRLQFRAVVLRGTTRPSWSRCVLQNGHSDVPRISMKGFSTTVPQLKKKGSKSTADKETSEDSSAEATADDFPDHDLATLGAAIEKTLEMLRNDLSKLRTGGRFNPEVLENVRVHLQKDSKSTIRLGELAQVVPKAGRNVMILVGDKDHIKPIVSAIQGAKNLNLQPQQDPHSSLQLNVPIPPPTKESRDQAISAATAVGRAASIAVNNARAIMQKRCRAMESVRTMRPDDLKKAKKHMEKAVDEATANVKSIVDAAKKTMEQA